MENRVPGGFRRFVNAATFAMIIVGLATAGSGMTPFGSTLPRRSTMVETTNLDSDSYAPTPREGVQAAWKFFTRLASFLNCSRDWLTILAGFLGYADASLTNVVAVADTCHPAPGLYALGRWIGGTQ